VEIASMPAEPLTALEREEIRAGIVRGEPDGVIAGRLGRHRLTINAEVARNGGRDDYRATAAQDRAEQQRLRPKAPKLVADPVLAAHVTARLEAKDSPMTIARELAAGTNGVVASISHECIYQAVYGHSRRGLRKGLHAYLHRRRRCRKRRLRAGEKPVVAGPLKDFNLIALRPPEADGRSEVGHLEGDLIVGAFNRSAIATVFDRASRHVWLADLPEGHGAEPVLAALIELLERIPEALRCTLTWDQGREMAEHHLLADATGIGIYFAEPHSPWQRPTNENGNGLLRRYVGKGTDLGVYTPDDLRAIEHRLNTMPRRSLGWSTAATAYAAAVAMTG
jgi:IS30 family transposase